MRLTKKLTLASQSKIRAAILNGAGLAFNVHVSGVDEATLKAAHKGTAESLAGVLASAKARAVFDDGQRDGLIVGADQILECDGVLYDKPRNMDEARANLATWCSTHPSSKAIGAKELIAYLKGDMSLSDAQNAATLATRQYAKRQRTWFRNNMTAWTALDTRTL